MVIRTAAGETALDIAPDGGFRLEHGGRDFIIGASRRFRSENLEMSLPDAGATRLETEAGGLVARVRTISDRVVGGRSLRAERAWLHALPHVVVIVDRVVSSDPVELIADFSISDADGGLRTNIATQTRLVLRQHDAAMKFFLMVAETDGSPAETVLDSGLEDGLRRVRWLLPASGREHLMVFAAVLEAEPGIPQWHIDRSGADAIRIEGPDGSGLTVRFREAGD